MKSNKSKLVVFAKPELSINCLQQNWAVHPVRVRVGQQAPLWLLWRDVSS